MAKKALVYLNDITLGRTGETITREEQKKAVIAYAAKNGIEILDIFEDEGESADILDRPGVKKLLACKLGGDLVLVERIWALSRNMKALRTFFTELEARNVKLEAATTLWDCASQMTRHHFATRKGAAETTPAERVELPAGAGYKVRRPAQLYFLNVGRNS